MSLTRKHATVLSVFIAGALVFALLVLPGCGKKKEQVEVLENKQATGPSNKAATSPTQTATSARSQPTQPGAEEAAVIIETARGSALANNAAIGDLQVLALKVVDGWARVEMQPVDRSTDAASWLLRKDGGTWRVIDFGTSILPSDHPDAPSEVFR
jgi:hypothetical protein